MAVPKASPAGAPGQPQNAGNGAKQYRDQVNLPLNAQTNRQQGRHPVPIAGAILS